MPALAQVFHHPRCVDEEPAMCKQVSSLFSLFVDAFVDYAVAGQVLSKPVAPPAVDLNALDGPSTKLNDAPPVVYEEGRRTSLPAAKRLIAIGDIHGDLTKARAALQVAQVIDEDDRWIGGETVVVQVGDLFDRDGD